MRFEKAKDIAEKFINKNYNVANDSLIILESKTIEKEYGWYFFSTSKRFLETKNWKDMVAGNGVVLVKKTGELVQFGTAYSSEYYISEFEKKFGLC